LLAVVSAVEHQTVVPYRRWNTETTHPSESPLTTARLRRDTLGS
jgi:hypothetical protein